MKNPGADPENVKRVHVFPGNRRHDLTVFLL